MVEKHLPIKISRSLNMQGRTKLSAHYEIRKAIECKHDNKPFYTQIGSKTLKSCPTNGKIICSRSCLTDPKTLA